MISAVVLAAGSAADPFSVVEDRPVLQWVLEIALASDLDEIICVTGDLAAVRRHVSLRDRRLCWFVSTAAEGGQSTALWATHPQTDGLMFLPGDRMPVRKDLINALIATFEQSGAWIVAPASAGQAGSPALFRRDLFSELLALSGNQNENSLLGKHTEKIVLVECQENGFLAHVAANQRRARLKDSL